MRYAIPAFMMSCVLLSACNQSDTATQTQAAPEPQAVQVDTTAPSDTTETTTTPTTAPAAAPTPAVTNNGSLQAQGTNLSAGGSNLSASGSSLSAEQSDFNIQIDLSADVLFDFDKSELKPEADAELQKVSDVIAKKGKGIILITGYTDGKGSDAYNLRLSQARAEAVKNWLLAQGLQQNYQTEGKGAANPIAPNTHADGSDNPEGRAKNRRVEIVVNKTGTLGDN